MIVEIIIKIIALAILTEALTELIFRAAPLQGIRQWLIKKTPLLRSEEEGHLLECKYCTSSVWVATGVVLLATFADCAGTRLIAMILIIGRLSNYVHILYSTIRDAQFNMRLKR